MEREQFYKLYVNYIKEINSGKSIGHISDKDNLFELGYTDSLNMVNVLVFLEVLLKEEIAFEKYELRNFYTMESVYNTFFSEQERKVQPI